MKRFIFIGFVLCCLMFSFVSSSTFAGPNEPVIKWKMQSAYPLHTASALPAVLWAAQMEKLTQGKLKIEVFAPGALCGTPNIIDAIENDALDAAMTYGGYYTGIVPETNLTTGLPMVHQNIDEMYDAWYNRGLIELVREAFAERNIRYYVFPVDHWYNYVLRDPIKSLADFKGKKIRAVGTFGEFTQLLGASAVTIPGAELYMALKLGTADGALYSAAGIRDLKLNEIIKYRIYPTICQISADIYVNQKSIDRLPKDLQSILLNASDDIFLRGGMQVQIKDHETQVWADKQGVKRIYLSDADIKKAMIAAEKVWDNVSKKSPRCKKGVDILKKQLRDLGRLQ